MDICTCRKPVPNVPQRKNRICILCGGRIKEDMKYE